MCNRLHMPVCRRVTDRRTSCHGIVRAMHTRCAVINGVSNVPLRTIIKLCSLLCSSLLFVVVVHAGCDKQDSLMRGGLCGKLHGGPSQLLFALHQSSQFSTPVHGQ